MSRKGVIQRELVQEEATQETAPKAKADPLARFSVTMPQSLLAELDRQPHPEGRSGLIRTLVRRYIAEERWKTNGEEQNSQPGEVYGTITLVYDHHLPNLTRELTEAQHDHGEIILCSTHVHLSHSLCLECVILRSRASRIQAFREALGRIRGIKSLEMTVTY